MGMVKIMSAALVVMLAWLGFVFYSAFNGQWMSPVAAEGDTEGFVAYAIGSLQQSNKGSTAMVLIQAGEPVRQFYSSPTGSVNADTVFAAASMSKWITAYAMMKLVEEGRADLDTPVSVYLSRWQLPDSEFDNDGVTIRRLLSHTAGLGDGLGFGDYTADEELPVLEQALSNPRTSSQDAAEIAVTAEPGSSWKYSGGGYLLLELLIEEISGRSFEDYVEEVVFTPLGMSAAGYDYLESYANNAGSYELDGSRATSYRYASSAATGLVISPADLTRFVIAQTNPAGNQAPLAAASIRSMREPHGKSAGFDIWGLGTILYAPTPDGDFIFGHDGANDPAINTAARINPATGDAIILLVTGHPSLATNIGSQWVLWQTGYPDMFATDAVFASMLLPALAGCGVIVIAVCAVGFRARARTRRRISPGAD